MTVLTDTIQTAFHDVLAASSDMSKIGQVLRDIKPVILEATTMKDIQEIVRRGAINIPVESEQVKALQGYVGRLVFRGGSLRGYTIASAYGNGRMRPVEMDPVQEAFGDTSIIAMLPVKALRAAAFLHRPPEAQKLLIEEYLAELGLTLGSAGTGDPHTYSLYSATGFQPTPETRAFLETFPGGLAHLAKESLQAFQGSGFCDQLMARRANGSTAPFESLAANTVEFPGLWN